MSVDNPYDLSDGELDVVTTTTTGARTRTSQELSAQIKRAGGALIVNANDSNYIVAANNPLKFSITRLQNGQFRITESLNYLLLIGVAVVAGVVLLSRR
jgi:hypothetical protein